MDFIRKIVRKAAQSFNSEIYNQNVSNREEIDKANASIQKLNDWTNELDHKIEDVLKYSENQSLNIAKHINNIYYHGKRHEDAQLVLSGTILSQINREKEFQNLYESEFKVFSQFGEDGIIQYILSKIDIKNKVFIEFGVEDYQEASTRFLLEKDYWQGLVMDGSAENVESIKKQEIYWKYDLLAKSVFVTKENINEIISEFTSIKDIGLLVVDIDGNDYWVWDEINVIEPEVVICEFNNIYGPDAKVVIPYEPDFYRTEKDESDLYFGASLNAIIDLGKKKGYTFLGCNNAGNDAFFVKNIHAEKFQTIIKNAKYIPSSFKESKDSNKSLTFLDKPTGLRLIQDHELLNLETNQIETIKDIFNL